MKRFSLLGLFLLFAALIGAPAANAQVNWTLGDVDAASHWGPKAATEFAARLVATTGARTGVIA